MLLVEITMLASTTIAGVAMILAAFLIAESILGQQRQPALAPISRGRLLFCGLVTKQNEIAFSPDNIRLISDNGHKVIRLHGDFALAGGSVVEVREMRHD